MLQLSFEFAGESPTIAERGVTDRRQGDLDRAYARASDWSRALATRLGQPIRLIVTDNRSTMLVARPKGGRLELRLHHMFLTADENILNAIGDYLSGNTPHAAATIDQFVEKHRSRFVAPGPTQEALRADGRYHDLRAIVDDLASRHFGADVDVRITWGRRVRPKRRQRSLQLGTYLPEERLIRISRGVSRDAAPRHSRGLAQWTPPLSHPRISKAGAQLRVPLCRAEVGKRKPLAPFARQVASI